MKVKEMETWARSYVKRHKKATIKNIVGELKFLKKHFPEMGLYKKQLFVVTNPIVLEDYPLGSYKIFYTNSQIKVLKHKDNKQYYSYYIHPHVYSNRLCFGSGEGSYLRAKRNNDIAEIFLIAEAVLNNYVEASSYRYIENFQYTDGYSCYYCDEVCDRTKMITTSCCGSLNCLNCTIRCKKCNRNICKSCRCVCERGII